MNFNPLFGLLAFFCFVSLQACSGSTSSVVSCTLGGDANVTVSGKATFDRIPLLVTGGLDFSNTSVQPVKNVVVEAVCNSVITSTSTDVNGNYSLSIPGNTDGVFVRVKAQMLKTGTPSWDVAVQDESQAVELIFSMDGSAFNSGTANSVRNLHAPSGWDGSSYSSARVAAPFAILDTINTAMQFVLAENPNAVFPALDVLWSSTSTSGTYYSNNQISVLGRTTDTDEYDQHVIAHEWGHYFQDAFSRDDSIGGMHSNGDILDIRVAFSEGFGNAFSSMVLDDPIYKDSQSVVLQNGFTINVESNTCTTPGWFSECSVQSVLYDFYDSNSDGSDTFSLGFNSLFNVLTVDLPDSDALTSLFSFIDALKDPGNETAVDALLAAQLIDSITDEFGTGVSDGAYPYPGIKDTNVIPVYATSFPALLCTTGENGGYNGLGVTRFMRFTVPSDNNYTFQATKFNGLTSTDPDMYITTKGQLVGYGESLVNNSETFTANLVAGTVYVLQLVEWGTYSNPGYDPDAAGAINETCFTVTRT